MSDLIDVVRALRVELEQSYRRDARSREDVVAAACKAAEAEAELDRVDEALREAGIEYPLGARGVADLRSMAVGRLDELQQALQRIADLTRERDEAQAQALRSAAADLQAMTMDPYDLLTESVGIKGPIAVALWLRDRADTYREGRDG